MSTDVVNNTCRVCLKTINAIGVSLDNNPRMLEIFEFCVGYTVDLNFSPKKICQKCVEEVDNFAKFKRQCAESEKHWKSINIDITEYRKQCDLNPLYNIEEAPNTFYCGDSSDICEEKNVFIKTDRQQSLLSDLNYMNNNKVKKFYEKNADVSSNSKKKYVCCLCKKEYSRYKWLLSHQMNVCYKHKYKTSMDKEISGIKLEMRTEHISSYDDCGLCNTTLNYLNSHLDEHWRNNDLNCKICDYTGKDFANMIAHRHVHSNKMKLFCHVCNKKKASMLSLEFHFRAVHLRKIGGLCTICSKTFTKFKTWKKHVRLHNEDNKLFICDICGKKFLYRHEIKSHLIDHSNVRQFVCETCGKDFKRMSALKKEICTSGGAYKSILNEQDVQIFAIVAQIEPLPNPYDDAALYFGDVEVNYSNNNNENEASELIIIHKDTTDHLYTYEHIANMHRPNDPVKCSHCSKTYKSETKLNVHLKNISKEKLYICKVCSKRFITENVLKKHMFWHTGERPYTCEVCGLKYKAKGQLNLHMRNHTGFMPHKCPDCGKGFPTGKQLKRHKSVHTGVRAHKCLHCERSFHEKKALLEHGLQHKNIELVKLETGVCIDT